MGEIIILKNDRRVDPMNSLKSIYSIIDRENDVTIFIIYEKKSNYYR